TLKYRTNIEGEEQDISLPLRTMVLGDFSQGSSKDRQESLEDRRLRSIDGTNRVDDLMKDMDITLQIKVPNQIDRDKGEVEVARKITSMKSFSNDEVAQHIQQVKALTMLKQLLLEMQSNIDNRRDLRKLVQELYQNPDSLQKTLAELKAYGGF